MTLPPVLLTGATGFLGMEVLARLLERDDRDVVCLVRARDDGGARERLDDVLATLFDDPEPVADAAIYLLSPLARASSSGRSNEIDAAQCMTAPTSSAIAVRSAAPMPRPALVTSPATARTRSR